MDYVSPRTGNIRQEVVGGCHFGGAVVADQADVGDDENDPTAVRMIRGMACLT